ncbi:IclR family transcriptional regulator [Phaeobacter gallaeciensis]|uniref:Acetate operon repressor-like protein n=1 Tax=Phaeobacter gallaeciensis TaxID=60890 RepID=A0AAD0EDT5_9RHOB|nr:IclR family transcriptional regulator [Phaeobacter gallaeciensis]AHD10508.1 transcriptional regulator, IclR family [Phaeobacter gallaeciensis DSM 26640]ATE93771.1 acetate operon repressor-like protein [Phaeobacter gallaeciensis]ATE96408.1 acetate operon repressor-like protein [Phaeobacter gallaeciensis]ATF02435.1 acetate operon repressor-like protein [Phaeobacter gallaeciensis]ATF06815.1 acetate operon repressor-like protein [Phaeobacter gallaeciensis]
MQDRQILLLEAVASSASPVSASELAQMTATPRASLYRHIAALLECGFLEETETGGRYILGLRFVKIALTGKSDTHVINAVSAVLQRVVKDLSETAFLARYRGGRVDLIHTQVPADPSVPYIYPGLGTRPVHACSSAKAIAAFLAPELQDDLIDTLPMRFTDKTRTDPEQIARELQQVRRYGYATCDGEIDIGVTSVAVPIIVDRLGAIFSMGVVGPTSRITPAIQPRILPILTKQTIHAAAAIQHCSVVEAETTNANSLAAAQERAGQQH